MKDGFLLIDKEEGWTSRDVCNKIQGILNSKKVGHSGTLDPFATGLLLVSVGKATKAISFLENFTKEYVAVLSLGKKTNTGDLTGEIVEEKEVPTFSKVDLTNVSEKFTGSIEQIPPMTSAIKVDGIKLYKLAHEGIEVERKPRTVEVYSLQIALSNKNELLLKTHVSKGTYIRTLGEDIAESLGTVGHLTVLRRTKINDIDVNKAKKINEITENDIIPISDILSSFMEVVKVDDATIIKVKNGLALPQSVSLKKTENLLIIDNENNAIAVYNKGRGNYTCKRGLW